MEEGVARLSDAERHDALGDLNGWDYDEERRGLVRTFRFSDFGEAFGFMARVALEAAASLSGGEAAILQRPVYGVADPAFGPLSPDAMISPRVASPMIGRGLIEAEQSGVDLIANNPVPGTPGLQSVARYATEGKGISYRATDAALVTVR